MGKDIIFSLHVIHPVFVATDLHSSCASVGVKRVGL